MIEWLKNQLAINFEWHKANGEHLVQLRLKLNALEKKLDVIEDALKRDPNRG